MHNQHLWVVQLQFNLLLNQPFEHPLLRRYLLLQTGLQGTYMYMYQHGYRYWLATCIYMVLVELQ